MKQVFCMVILFFYLSVAFPVEFIIKFARQLPERAFGHTTQGLQKDKLDVLLKTGKTNEWSVKSTNKNYLLIVDNDRSDSLYKIFLLKTKKTPVICINTFNVRNAFLECWTKKNGSNVLSEIYLVPKLHVNEFLKNKLPQDYELYANFYLDDNGVIRANLNTWMNPDFENIELYWDIHLKWDGEAFKVVKVRHST